MRCFLAEGCTLLQGVLMCLSGRLLLDTYVQSRDLLKEVEYSLATLSSKLLNQQRMELNPHQVQNPPMDCSLPFGSIALSATAASTAWCKRHV